LRALSNATGAEVDLSAYRAAVDRWAIFCAQALHFERTDLVDEAIGKLCEAYQTLGVDEDANRKRPLVVERIYVVGGIALRLGAWETMRSLALRPVPGNTYEPDYVYSSGIRAAQVYASRAGMIDDDKPGYLLSAARELMIRHPAMRPDLPDRAVPSEEVNGSDAALNSLCQFDLTYCMIVVAMGTGHSSASPSSAAFDENRAKPIAQKIVADAAVRQRLFPNVSDAEIAAAITSTYDVAIHRSANNYGSRWWTMPPIVEAFVTEHGESPT
jgi:hypothetical protein